MAINSLDIDYRCDRITASNSNYSKYIEGTLEGIDLSEFLSQLTAKQIVDAFGNEDDLLDEIGISAAKKYFGLIQEE